MSKSPSQRADDARSAESSDITPLGTVKATQNGNSITLVIPLETARALDVVGDEFHVGYEPSEKKFHYQNSETFDGWD